MKGNDSNSQSGTLSEGDVAVRPSNILPDSPSAPKTQSVLSIRIPDIKIEAFSGNVVDFTSWEIAFDAIVDSHVHCTDVKINLLCQHLAGDAKSSVLGLLSHRSETSYKAARKRLKERYGNPSILCQAFLDRIEEWPVMKANQPKELQQFSDLLVQTAELRKSIGGLRILDFPQESKKILIKLPMYFENEWREAVYKWRDKKGSDSYPPFDHLVEFTERRATRANIPELHGKVKLSNKGKTFQQERRSSNNVRALSTTTKFNSFNKPARALATTANSAQVDTKKCSYCDESHEVNDCTKIMQLSDDERFRFFQDKHLCFGCGISSAHQLRQCQNRAKCTTCGGPHPTPLHRSPPREQPQQASSYCTEAKGENSFDCSIIIPCWVQNEEIPGKEIISYCILDDKSNTCFVSNPLKEKLGLIGQPTNLTLSTIQKSNTLIPTEKVFNLRIQSLDQTVSINVPQIFSKDTIPASRQQIPTADVEQKWEHLKCIASEMHPYFPEAEIGLLLGSNLP